MGAVIYSNKVNNRIVELENEYERKEFLGTLGCVALLAMGVLGILIRTGVF